MITLLVLITLSISYYFVYKAFSKPKPEITREVIEKKVAAIKKANEKANQFPKFIPFYEWHGFLKGLHHENRRFVMTNGKEGRKPNKWQ